MADPTSPGPEAVPDQTSFAKSIDSSAYAGLTSATSRFAAEGKQIANLSSFFAKSYLSGLQSIPIDNVKSALANTGLALADFAEMGVTQRGMSPLIESIKEGTRQLTDTTSRTAAGLQEITYLSLDSAHRTEFGIDSLTQKVVKNTFEMQRAANMTTVELLNGVRVPYHFLLESTTDLSKKYQDTVLSHSNLFKAGVKGQSEEAMKATEQMTRVLGISAADVTKLYEIEQARTGQISGDILKRFETVVLAAGQMGANIPMVSKDLITMMTDVKRFGEMTEPQMISLSEKMSTLGIDIKTVTGLADKFSNFETAIDTVNKLTAATGATLDTMSLFELSASGDIEGFVEELKSQFDSMGVEYESLNRAQKNMIAESFGMDPVKLEQFMRPASDVIGSIAAEVEATSEKISDAERQKRILSMDKLRADIDSTAALSARIADVDNAVVQSGINLEKGTNASVSAITTVVDAATKGMAATKNLITDISGIAAGAGDAVVSTSKKLNEAAILNENTRKIVDQTKASSPIGTINTPPVTAAAPVVVVPPSTPTAPTAAAASTTPSSTQTKEPVATSMQPTATQEPQVVVIDLRLNSNVLTTESITHGVTIDDRQVQIKVSNGQ